MRSFQFLMYQTGQLRAQYEVRGLKRSGLVGLRNQGLVYALHLGVGADRVGVPTPLPY